MGTIVNDDGLPKLSITDVSVVEGNTGTTPATFKVTLTPASAQTVTVDYATANGSATVANGDYAAASGTLTFDPGQTAKTVDVTVHGDTTYEADETLTAGLSTPVGATIAGNPLYVTHVPGDTSRIFVVTQSGTIRIIRLPANTLEPTPFLTVPNATFGGETGLAPAVTGRGRPRCHQRTTDSFHNALSGAANANQQNKSGTDICGRMKITTNANTS